MAADTLSNIRWGGSITTEAFTVYFDDMIYTTDGNDYPIGAGGIKSLVPNVTSTVSDASGFIDADDGSAITTADSSWSRIDERPVTSMTDYIKQTGNATSAYASYGFEDVASSGCINAVSGVATLRSSTTTANSAKTAIWEGGTERTIFSGDMSPGTGAQEYRSKIIAPATGSWDATKLSGTTGRLGYWNGTGGQPYWDGLMLEYDQVADASTAYENVVLSDSPAGYWRLGETTGNTATARSGTPNGTYTNSPVLGVSGQVGDSNLGMYVTGSNQINYGDNYDFAGTANFTFEFWVVLSSSTPNNARVFSKEGIGGYDLRASQSGGGYKLLFSRMDNGFTSDQTNPATILSAGTPYHVAITYDGSNIRTYYNGVLAGTTASTRSVGNDGTPLAFGSSNGGSNGIIGQLDELAIYTSPLSLVRIQAHYDAGKL